MNQRLGFLKTITKNSAFVAIVGILSLVSHQSLARDLIVKLRDNKNVKTHQTQMMSKYRGAVQMRPEGTHGRLVRMTVSETNILDTVAKMMKDPNVEYLVEDFKLRAVSAPIDLKNLKPQWALAKVQAEKAWALAGNKGNKKIVIAVIDTGVDGQHEALNSNMVEGYDFKDNDNDAMDITGSRNPGHGTHCAGIIGATGVIDEGVIGISPDVSIMPLRFLGADGSGDLMAGIRAIDYAIEKGANVISASWGATVNRSQARPLVEAVKRASDAGVIFVAAAANDGRSNDKVEVYPANANFENTITVAASGDGDEKPSWSNYGKRTVDLASPGLNIMSTLPKNKYGNLSGTSMATPLVSGLVGFLLAQDSKLTGAQIRSILQTSGSKVDIETACNCRVDALAATESVMNKKMVVVPATASLMIGENVQFGAVNGKAPFVYQSANPEILNLGADGVGTGMMDGRTTITVTDADGVLAKSLDVVVWKPASKGGQEGGIPADFNSCPFSDSFMCDGLCLIDPSIAYCSKKTTPPAVSFPITAISQK